MLGRLAEEYGDRVVETPSPEGLPYAHQSFMEEDSLCSEDSLDNQNATNDSTRDGCESLAMLREQLKNGGVLAKNPIYENLEGLGRRKGSGLWGGLPSEVGSAGTSR